MPRISKLNIAYEEKLLEFIFKKTLINCLSGRIAALRGARNLNIFLYMPRFLRSVCLALHPAQTINQHFLKNGKFLYLSVYTILFIAALFLAFPNFFLKGRSFVGVIDGMDQHFNALVYFGEYFRRIFLHFFETGNFVIPMFDFSIGFGADILVTLHYNVIGDPLNFLAVFVPLAYTEILYTFLIFFRLYLAGLAFSAYCRQIGLFRSQALCGSLMYAFCGFAVFFAPVHPFFLNPLIYLPLLLTGVEKILKGSKPYFFIAMVFISAISNFYFFYKLTLLVVIYMAFRLLALFSPPDGIKNALKNLFKRLGQFFLYYVTGLAMAGIIFLPSVIYMLSTNRANINRAVAILYPLSDLRSFLPGFLTLVSNSELALYHLAYPPIAFFAIVFLFLKRKAHPALKISFILLTLFLIMPIAGYIFNGFSYPANRWVFGYSFLVALITAVMLPSILAVGKKHLGILGGLFALYSTGAFFLAASLDKAQSAIYPGILLSGAGAVLIMAALYLFIRSKKTKITEYMLMASILLITIAGAGCQGLLMFTESPGRAQIANYLDSGEALYISQNGPSSAVGKTGDDSFFRYDRIPTAARPGLPLWVNSFLLDQQNSTGFYFSLLNPYIHRFYFNDMNMPGVQDFHIEGLRGQAHLMSLLSTKYHVESPVSEISRPYGFNNIVYIDERHVVLETPNVLPLGFTYDFLIMPHVYDALSPVEKQQALLQGAVINKNDSDMPDLPFIQPVFNHVTGSLLKIAGIGEAFASVEGVSYKGGVLVVPDTGATFTFNFTGLPMSEIYLSFDNLRFARGRPDDFFSDDVWANKTDDERISFVREHTPAPTSDFMGIRITVAGEEGSTAIQYWLPGSMGYSSQHDFTVNLGYREEAKREVSITFPIAGMYAFDSIYIHSLPMDGLSGKVNNLTHAVLENASVRTGNLMGSHKITGTIETDQNRLLAFSIPYSAGWNVFLNGQRAPLLNINTMLMGVYVTKGSHEVTLTYTTPWLNEGIILSLAGLLGLGLVAIYFDYSMVRRYTPS